MKVNGENGEEDASSIPKMPSSDTVIRGTLWFDNMYPLRVHWLDVRYLVATHNHDVIIPKLFATAFGIHGFRLIGATPRANEGGVFVHFEVDRQGTIRTPEDVTKAIITLLRAKPVHALLTPKAVRCHLVKGSPFLDDLASRFPYNRLKIELKGPASGLQDLTVEQLYNEFSQFGKIFDLVLNPYEKDKPRTGVIQYVRMYSAVGARNCLHRLKMSIPLTITSLPSSVPPKTETSSTTSSGDSSSVPPPPKQPTPTADAYLYLTYDSILKTSVVTDFFTKHPRIMVPLLGFLFAAFTYLIFDPLRSFNITNHITKRFDLQELYNDLPWPFGWLKKQASKLSKSSMFQMLKHTAGFDHEQTIDITNTWSSRQADEEKVRKWLNSKPDRLLFLTGPKGAGKQALVKKLTSDRKNVVVIDIGHIIDRADDEFIKGLAASIGFAPGFALLTWISSVMDIFTPGASKASGSSTASSAQILKILECTSDALINIARKEVKRQHKDHAAKLAKLSPEERAAMMAPPPSIDVERAHNATEKDGPAAAAMDNEIDKKKVPEDVKPKEKSDSSENAFTKLKTTFTSAVGLSPKVTDSGDATSASKESKPNAASSSSSPSSSPPPPPSSSSPSSSSSPTSTNPVPSVSNTPVVVGPSVGSFASSSDAAPLRLTEPKVAASQKDQQHLTEQQRNYIAYVQSQQAARERERLAREKAEKEEDEIAEADGSEDGLDENVKARLRSERRKRKSNVLGGLVEHEPDNLPLFVIDGFNAENASKHSNFLNVLVSWSHEMSAAGCARFVYLTDSALEESVSKALPEVKMAEVLLSDASPEAAQEFLFASLPPQMRRAIPDSQTVAALQILGGRFNDLVTLARGIEDGIHPIETVEEIVIQSMNAVKSMLFSEDKNVKWNKVQMWQVLTMLVDSPNGTVLYDDVLFNIFSGDDTPLKSLVRADLLRVEPGLSSGGDRLKAGSPVMNEAFKRLLVQQVKLRPGMDQLVLQAKISKEQSKINAIEEELMRIAQTADEVIQQRLAIVGGRAQNPFHDARREKGWKPPINQILPTSTSHYLLMRQNFLLDQLQESHAKILAFEQKRKACEKEVKAIKRVE